MGTRVNSGRTDPSAYVWDMFDRMGSQYDAKTLKAYEELAKSCGYFFARQNDESAAVTAMSLAIAELALVLERWSIKVDPAFDPDIDRKLHYQHETSPGLERD